MTIRIGTSGWVYPHWREVFYPADLRQADWFDHYACHFDTVEINNSFYRLPSEAVFAKWRAQAPAGFLYAVKASRFLTHLKKLKEPQSPLHNFFTHAAHLGDSFGPVLYQLPPRWQLNLSRLQGFLAALPHGRHHVLEFRDPSWLVEPVFRLLERYGVAHCIHDLPPLDIPHRITAPFVYLRYHGDRDHSGDYPTAHLELQARQITAWHDQGLDVFVYFNNDVGAYAVKNAMRLKSLLPDTAVRDRDR
ncbi:MAG: DUF72 domain-containing protein [Desulfuromonadales bacterium]|nr:DUF72 domain-containing protein [Desulfuromonadales bacterium]